MKFIKSLFDFILIILCSFATVLFLFLYIESFNGGFFEERGELLKYLILLVMCSLTLLTIIFSLYEYDFAYKLGISTLIFLALMSLSVYWIKKSGLWDRIDSVEDLRDFVSEAGGFAIFLFLAIQILQVVLLPVPGFITVSAGVALFGAFRGSVLSFLGIYAGSVVAFAIGRVFGHKAANWLVGKENLDKALKLVKGKDKIILTFMFLFPFFPDDVLCFVSGLSSMSWTFYLIMIAITRLISIFTTSYTVSGSIIPYDTWWGIVLYVLFFAATAAAAIMVYKRGDRIQKFIKRKFFSKKSTKGKKN